MNLHLSNMKTLLLLLVGVFVFSVLNLFCSQRNSSSIAKILFIGPITREDFMDETHRAMGINFYRAREKMSLSKLGDILFKGYLYPDAKWNTSYKILIWKEGLRLQRRHLSGKSPAHAFDDCVVDNCVITYEDDDLPSADAVVFLLHSLKSEKDIINLQKLRKTNQRWIFLTDESPVHTFLHKLKWPLLNGIFNWSMSYKMNSDIPVPYGRVEPLAIDDYIQPETSSPEEIVELIPYSERKQKRVLAAIMISNCSGERMKYLKELQMYLEVDVYGACGKKFKYACEGHQWADCPNLRQYLFYLSFENSLCDQYVTEKLFWNAFENGAIPVILGPSKSFCKTYLPHQSYLHVEDYARPADLARHILYLNSSQGDEFFTLHQWRRHFYVLNEHGYHGSISYHYCRICEALNYNDQKPKVYEDLSPFLNASINCRKQLIVGDSDQEVVNELNKRNDLFNYI